MDTLSYKTISVNKANAHKEWVVVDATDQVLGRLGAKVAKLLRGKYKPSFTPNADCGDNVIIINANKVRMTGNKWTDRVYLRFSGYPGGQKQFSPADVAAGFHLFKILRKFQKLNIEKVLCHRIIVESVFAGNNVRTKNCKTLAMTLYFFVPWKRNIEIFTVKITALVQCGCQSITVKVKKIHEQPPFRKHFLCG